MSFLTSDSFIFNGVNSADYNVMISWFDSDADVSVNGLNREIKKSTTSKIKMKDNIYGAENTEVVTFTFCIIKTDGSEITREESISMNQWLTSSPLPQLLEFNDKDSYMLHYYAICTQIKDIIVGNSLVGKELKFETNSPFAFMKKSEKTFTITGEHTFYLNNTSDTYDGIYYPVITITATSNNVVIENITDEKSVTLNMTNLPSDANGKKTITLDCMNMKILNIDGKLVYASDLGWDTEYKSHVSSTNTDINTIYWVRLLKGMNKIKVSGNCTFKIEYEFPRKAGCL